MAGIVGIDPGSKTLGLSLLLFDIRTLEIVSSQAYTIRADKLANGSWESEFHGDRLGRINAIKNKLLEVFRHAQPYLIATESPFYSFKHPNAYGVLMEVIGAIRQAAIEYDMFTGVYEIDPPTVKNAVGAKGNAKKEEVRERILKMSDQLHFRGPVPIDQLDEHSLDALAVAYSRYKTLLEVLWISK